MMLKRMTTAEAPVWEYRIWPEDAGELREQLEACFDFELEPPRTDIYFVIDGEIHQQAKLRDRERLNIKERLATEGALERWQTLVDTLPPARGKDRAVLERLYPQIDSRASSPESLRHEFSRYARVLEARKTRLLATDESGLRAEIGQIDIEGRSHESFCLEHESAEGLSEAVSGLRFSNWPNISYPTFLQPIAFPA